MALACFGLVNTRGGKIIQFIRLFTYCSLKCAAITLGGGGGLKS